MIHPEISIRAPAACPVDGVLFSHPALKLTKRDFSQGVAVPRCSPDTHVRPLGSKQDIPNRTGHDLDRLDRLSVAMIWCAGSVQYRIDQEIRSYTLSDPPSATCIGHADHLDQGSNNICPVRQLSHRSPKWI